MPLRLPFCCFCAAALGVVWPAAAWAAPLAPRPAQPLSAPVAAALKWKPCGPSQQRGFECATVPVPVDHARPQGPKLALAVIRRRASGGAAPIGSLFVSFGGPGVAGTRTMAAWSARLPPGVLARFDVIGWDPRGTGASGALNCFASPADAASFLRVLPVGFPEGGSQIRQWNRTWAEAVRRCTQGNSLLLPHLSTADSARDLERLRQAIGAPELRFRGTGWGSLVGATYANLFPARVRGMLLDGAIDPFAWSNGGNPSSSQSTAGRLEIDLATGASLRSFLQRCAAVGRPACPFAASGPGGDPAAMDHRLTLLLDRLSRRPIQVQGRSFGAAGMLATLIERIRVVDPVADGSGGTMGGWQAAAGLLRALEDSGSSDGLDLGGRAVEPDRLQELAVQCSESPNPRSGDAYPALAARAVARGGPAAATRIWADAPCASWPVAAASPHSGPWNSPTRNTVLVIGTRFDPITPFQGSLTMARELGNARLLSVNGYGHTTLLNRSACASRYETAYWLQDLLPPEATVCTQDRAPF